MVHLKDDLYLTVATLPRLILIDFFFVNRARNNRIMLLLTIHIKFR